MNAWLQAVLLVGQVQDLHTATEHLSSIKEMRTPVVGRVAWQQSREGGGGAGRLQPA